MRRIFPLIASVILLGSASATLAAPCKDAKGKFTKCPPAKAVPCKDAKGKFVKCSAPGAKPIK
ncbi:hypothetical protein [Sphingomonas nostoxanthinifaciens]|uniref:hypothetical protein n=1 Tax=Sphingomonas nostoxanthinifaciens TaxID=2872652 RepID=UPI001CC1D9E0|nr:hypothetical protein [Sphingomonas nostoxanthinifaciens]UAK24976.1 hypothetical protein K8P63_01815 [Sphingomonas nostoxanthinifaciens]